jgi:hypothetical protein
MRLRIKKSLKGGLYCVSFETLGFNPEESEWIKKNGMPIVDLSDIGLGTPYLDQLNFLIRCRDAQEADDIIRRIRQRTKDRLAELLAWPDDHSFAGRTGISKWGKVSVLGTACAVVFLLSHPSRATFSRNRHPRRLV